MLGKKRAEPYVEIFGSTEGYPHLLLMVVLPFLVFSSPDIA